MRELALFAGAGGGILGGKLMGWRTVCAVEIDAYCRSVLLARQRDGWLEPFPIWDDVETFDGHPWRGVVDVVSGGFPCQDISSAGIGAGIRGERSGLWAEFARIIGEVQPASVWVENSPMLTVRGLDVVLGDLSALGYDARWGVVSAADAIWAACLASGDRPCLDHERERIWILACADAWSLEGRKRYHADMLGRWSHETKQAGLVCADADADPVRCRQGVRRTKNDAEHCGCNQVRARGTANSATTAEYGSHDDAVRAGRNGTFNASWWCAEPAVGRVAHGVAHRVDRLKAIGNGQVPQAMELAYLFLGKK